MSDPESPPSTPVKKQIRVRPPGAPVKRRQKQREPAGPPIPYPDGPVGTVGGMAAQLYHRAQKARMGRESKAGNKSEEDTEFIARCKEYEKQLEHAVMTSTMTHADIMAVMDARGWVDANCPV